MEVFYEKKIHNASEELQRILVENPNDFVPLYQNEPRVKRRKLWIDNKTKMLPLRKIVWNKYINVKTEKVWQTV